MSNPNNPTANGLASAMWDIFQQVSKGDMSPAAANAATNSAQSIMRIFVQQMNYARWRNETPEIAFFANPAMPIEEPRKLRDSG